jgi:hypothetical protein
MPSGIVAVQFPPLKKAGKNNALNLLGSLHQKGVTVS